jgi:tetratricopeptide (TPR) repeat protein
MNPETRVQPPDVHSSQLLSLARVAMADSVGPDGLWRWPTLDFNDPAQRRFGDYELLAELGRGGMGVVYRARQQSLDREVAIKFIAAGLSDTHQVTRFIGEARAAARLVHPNIVPVFEVGSVDEIHYFSMPLIEGISLAQRLEQGPLPQAELLRLLLRVCEAVDYAHRLGLLHLDLKPANVLIDARGEPLIADFGLARHMDESGAVQAQEVSGTPAFMAPEQILIRQYRLTAATDLYALGALLYRCLSGHSPHGEGNADELIRRALAGRVRPLRELAPGVPSDLAAVCEKCLELEPRDRYPSVRALIDDLRRVESGLPVSVRRPGLAERAQRWLRREPKLAVAAGIAFAAIALGGGVAVGLWREAEAARALAVQQRDAADAARAAEAAQRQRAEDAVALGAMLFGEHGGPDLSDVAVEVTRWLRARAPGDETRQGAVLAAFAQAMGESGARLYVAELLSGVMEEAGAEYRRAVTAQLQSREDADSLANAAMFVWRDQTDPQRGERAAELLRRALDRDPGNRFAWYLAAIQCDTEGAVCPHPEATDQIVRLDPDNGFAHVLAAMSLQGERAWNAIHQAASAEHFNDYFGASYESYAKAIEAAGVPPPGLVVGVAQALAPGASVEGTVAEYEAWAMPMPRFQRIIDHCHPDKLLPADPSVRADCIAIGQRMARTPGGLITNMIGSAIARRLGKGTPLEMEMKAIRARYVYLTEVYSTLSEAELLGYGRGRLQRDAFESGEMEAYARLAAHFGKPTEPPTGWVPKDPQTLLLPEERSRN